MHVCRTIFSCYERSISHLTHQYLPVMQTTERFLTADDCTSEFLQAEQCFLVCVKHYNHHTVQSSVKSVTQNTLFNLYCHLSGEETEAERSYLLNSHGLSVSQCATLFRAHILGQKMSGFRLPVTSTKQVSFLLHKTLHFP